MSRIVNTWDQMTSAGGDRVGIFYHAPDYGRGGSCAKWVVIRLVDGKEIPTNPNSPWYDWGHKTFNIGAVRVEKAPRLEAAIAWVTDHYGKRDFVRNRMGDYVEREANERFPLPKRERKAVGSPTEDTPA